MINIQNVQFSHATFELIYNLVSHKLFINKKNQIVKDFKESIKFKNIYFGYGNQEILKGINIEIKKNKILGIVGPSGSGKTTLLNIITGLLKFDKGNIYVDEKIIDPEISNLMSLFSYVPQSNLLIEGNLIDNIVLGQSNHEINFHKIHNILSKLNLDSLLDSLPDKLYTDVGKDGAKLSGGQAQRICIARALYFDRKILILDEPTSSLDGENEEEFLNYLDKLKSEISIIIVSHKAKTIGYCDLLIEI